MISVEDQQRLSRYRAGELSAEEARALEAELAARPELAQALAQLPAPEAPVAPSGSPAPVSAPRPASAPAAPRQAWGLWLLSGSLAVALVVMVAVPAPNRATALAGPVTVRGKTLVAGESVMSPKQLVTGVWGSAEVRMTSGTLVLLPEQSVLEFADAPELVRGAVGIVGRSPLVVGDRHLAIDGEAFVALEPLEGSFRRPGHLTRDDIMSARMKVRVAAAPAAEGRLTVAVLEGRVTITSAGTSPVSVEAGDEWKAPSAKPPEPSKPDAGAPHAGGPVMHAAAGTLEVLVTAAGVPVPNAQVRSYFRLARESTSGRRWVSTGVATTDKRGVARFPAQVGVYAVTVRSKGRPTTTRQVQRTLGVAKTSVEVTLDGASRLLGITEDAHTRQPVAPATITLTPRDAPDEEAIITTVDASGRFSFEFLAPGTWVLRGQAPGSGSAPPVTLQLPTSEVTTLSFHATGFLDGLVMLPDGGPAAGAKVFISGEEPQILEASGSGSFSAELEPGPRQVQASIESFSARAPGQVVVRSGQTSSVRITLANAPTLSGHVTAKGKPVADALVSISPPSIDGELALAVSDERGRYAVQLAPGRYDVKATALGATDAVRGLLVGLEDATADLQLEPGATLRGVVTDATGRPVEGELVTVRSPGEVRVVRVGAKGRFEARDLPPGLWLVTVAGTRALVELDAAEVAERALKVEAPGTVDAQLSWRCAGSPPALTAHLIPAALGSIAATALPVGAGAKTFSAPVAPGKYRATVTTADGACFGSTAEFEVKANVHVPVSIALDQRGQPLELQVNEADGKPSPHAVVTLSDSEGGRVIDTGIADDEGLFRYDRPLTGPIRVVGANGSRYGSLPSVSPEQKQVTLTLGTTAPLRLTLENVRPGARTSVELTVSSGPGYRDALVTTSAHLRVEAAPVGALHLTLRSEGRAAQADVLTQADAEAHVTVKLEEGATIRGLLVDVKGQVVNGGVSLRQERRTDRIDAVRVDDSGAFSLAPVAPGAYVLEATSGRARKEVPVTLAPGQVLDLGEVMLEPPTRP